MKLIIQFPLVAEFLTDQVTAVGGRVDQHIFRSPSQSALNDGFQVLILQFALLERKVIHVNDKLVITVLHLLQDRGQCMELMLIDLYDPQSLAIVCI